MQVQQQPAAPASGIGEESRRLHAAFPVRKTAAQKQAFCGEAARRLEALGWPVRIEEDGRLLKTRNLVAGDPASARLVFTAHYDTPARMPFPNFITPRNPVLFLLYQVVVAGVLCAAAFGVARGLAAAGAPPLLAMAGSLAVLFTLLILMMAGPANPRNANDNTSGVLTLMEIARALPPGRRAEVALVFFDNEELGLVGSAAFRKKHGQLPEKLVLNFDCVGDGDTLLFVPPGRLKRDEGLRAALASAFGGAGGKAVLVDRSPFTLFPSDQYMFKNGVAVAALRRLPVAGYYVGRIHTGRDTVLDEANLAQLCGGACALLDSPALWRPSALTGR